MEMLMRDHLIKLFKVFCCTKSHIVVCGKQHVSKAMKEQMEMNVKAIKSFYTIKSCLLALSAQEKDKWILWIFWLNFIDCVKDVL